MSKLYKKRFYVFVMAFLATSFVFSYFVKIRPETQTSKITVKNNFTQLSCNALIKTLEAKSIHDFYFNKKLAHKADLEETICTLDKVFDGSDEDRALLYGFAEAKLEWSLINRHDIAHYFYRRIIDENPDDALSLYLKTEKIKASN